MTGFSIIRTKMCRNCKRFKSYGFCDKYLMPRNELLDPIHLGCFKKKKEE
jgi:hypothetical protein